MLIRKYWKWLLLLVLLAGVVAGGLVALRTLNANAAGNDVTITFNAGKYGNSTQTLEAGSEIGIAVDAAEPPYIGYPDGKSLVFYGWSLTDGGSDRVDGSMIVNSDTNLYAIFKNKSDYHTITWSFGTADSPSIHKDDDVFIGDTLIPFLDPHTRPGMYFDGWVKCADDTWKNCDSTRFDFVNAKVTGDMYFMATWKRIPFPLMWNLTASSNGALIHKTGSEWDLLDSNNKVLLHVVDNGENDADPDAGELRVNDVPLSTAKVVQTKTVDGFKLHSEPLTVYNNGDIGYSMDYASRNMDADICKNDEHDYCPKDSDVQSTWYSKQNLTGDVIDSPVEGGSGKQFFCFYLYEGYTLNPVVGAKFYYTATGETLTSDSNGKLCVNTVTSRKFSYRSGTWDSHFKSALINVDSSVESNLYGRVYAIRFEQIPRGDMVVNVRSAGGGLGGYTNMIQARFVNGGRLLCVRYYYPEYVSYVPLDSAPPVEQYLPFTVNFSPNTDNWYYCSVSVKATLTDGDASKVSGLDSNSEVKLENMCTYDNKLAGNLTGVEFSAPGVYKFSVVQTTPDFDRWQIDRTPDEITVTVSTNDDGTLSAKLTGTGDFTNVYQEPRAVSWLKVDADDASVKLAGSEWTLANADGSFNKSIVDNGENDADADAGELTVNDVPWGSYSLTETKAPADYEKLSASLTVIVDADGFRITGDGVSSVNNVFNVANKHVPLMTGFLPMTGRNAVFTVIAVAIMASVVAVLVMRKHD